MAGNIGRGMFRIWIVVSVLWINGMGYYQYQEYQQNNKIDNNSITIALSKDTGLRIDSNGISQTTDKDKEEVQMKRLALVLLPPILLLALFPVGYWLARGFKAT